MDDKASPQVSGQTDLPTLIKEAARLRLENAWLAAHQQFGVGDDEPTRCPPRRQPPSGCHPPDCALCWQNAAREALVGVPA